MIDADSPIRADPAHPLPRWAVWLLLGSAIASNVAAAAQAMAALLRP